MTNLEYYKDEINEIIENDRRADVFSSIGNAFDLFSFKHIDNYPLRPDKFIDWLLEEHKEPIKLKQWEYDLIEHYAVIKRFDGVDMLIVMRSKGHFKGIKDTSMSIQYSLNNCEVVE